MAREVVVEQCRARPIVRTNLVFRRRTRESDDVKRWAFGVSLYGMRAHRAPTESPVEIAITRAYCGEIRCAGDKFGVRRAGDRAVSVFTLGRCGSATRAGDRRARRRRRRAVAFARARHRSREFHSNARARATARATSRRTCFVRERATARCDDATMVTAMRDLMMTSTRDFTVAAKVRRGGRATLFPTRVEGVENVPVQRLFARGAR